MPLSLLLIRLRSFLILLPVLRLAAVDNSTFITNRCLTSKAWYNVIQHASPGSAMPGVKQQDVCAGLVWLRGAARIGTMLHPLAQLPEASGATPAMHAVPEVSMTDVHGNSE